MGVACSYSLAPVNIFSLVETISLQSVSVPSCDLFGCGPIKVVIAMRPNPTGKQHLVGPVF